MGNENHILLCYRANMTSGDINGGARTTPMGNETDARSLRRDPVAGEPGGGRVVPAGSLHDVGARGDGAPVAGGAAARAGAAVSGDRGAHARLDDDRDTRG